MPEHQNIFLPKWLWWVAALLIGAWLLRSASLFTAGLPFLMRKMALIRNRLVFLVKICRSKDFYGPYSSLNRIVATSLSSWNKTKRSWERCKLLEDNRCKWRKCWLGNLRGDFGGWCWQCHLRTSKEDNDDVNLAESVILMRMMMVTGQDWRRQQVLVSKTWPDLPRIDIGWK